MISLVITLMTLQMSTISSDSTASLAVNKSYRTSYYGDTFDFTCTVFIDKDAGDKFEAVEFVMELEFRFTWEYGKVCYAGSSRNEWPGVARSHRMCNPVNINSSGHGNLTLPITITEDMHTNSNPDTAGYKCILHYESHNIFYVRNFYEAESPLVALQIRNINNQAIHIDGPRIAKRGRSITFQCTSTNNLANLEFVFIPQVNSDLKEIMRNSNDSASQLEVTFTATNHTTLLECSDGGRRLENITFIRRKLRVLDELPTQPITMVTVTDQNSVQVFTQFQDTQPIYVGQTFNITCNVRFTRVPTSLQYVRLTRKSNESGRINAIKQCPPWSASSSGSAAPDRLLGVATCDDVIGAVDNRPTTTSYMMEVAIPATATLIANDFLYSCSTKYNNKTLPVSGSFQPQPIIYHLEGALHLSLSSQNSSSNERTVLCSYSTGMLPSTSNIKLVLSKLNSTILAQEVLGNVSLNIAKSQIILEKSVTVKCFLADVPAGAQRPNEVVETYSKDQSDSTTESTADVRVTMTLKALDRENQTYLVFDEVAEFSCTARLRTPLNSANDFLGITLILSGSENERYEDGCVTNIPAHKRFLSHSVKRCPTFQPLKTDYTAEISFTVTSELIGWKSYRCFFQAQRSYLLSTSNISSLSQPLVKLGIKKPQIQISPTRVEVFEGQILAVNCTSAGGYPYGQIQVTAGNITQTSTFSRLAFQFFQTRWQFTRQHIGKRIKCTNSRHLDIFAESDKIHVKYLMVLQNLTSDVAVNVNKNIKIDCNRSVHSNALLVFKWHGPVVVYTQKNKPVVDVIYSSKRKGKVINITCQVSMQGDTLNRTISVNYSLNFATSDVASLSKTTIAMVFIVAGILLLTMAIIGIAIGREVTSRKINSPILLPRSKFAKIFLEWKRKATKKRPKRHSRVKPLTTTFQEPEEKKTKLKSSPTIPKKSSVDEKVNSVVLQPKLSMTIEENLTRTPSIQQLSANPTIKTYRKRSTLKSNTVTSKNNTPSALNLGTVKKRHHRSSAQRLNAGKMTNTSTTKSTTITKRLPKLSSQVKYASMTSIQSSGQQEYMLPVESSLNKRYEMLNLS